MGLASPRARSRRAVLAASLVSLAGCQAPVSRSRGRRLRERPPISGTARIGFVGDLQFARRVEEAHEDRPPESVWGTTIERLEALDGLVANLECVLTDRGEEWPEKTWHFRADPEWVLPALETGGVSAVSLANNHTLDYGDRSLLDTIEHLSSIGVAHTGGGPDLEAASSPAVVDVGDVRVAMVGFTDRYSPFAADSRSPGTAYLPLSVDDTPWMAVNALERVAEADPDVVVASLHWGPNYEPKTDDHERFARWLIDHGVDVVHGHSAHMVQGVEVYRNRPIIYDTGDFVNDYSAHDVHYNDRSFLFELVVDDGLEELRLVPVEIDGETVGLAGDEARSWLVDHVQTLSAPYGTSFETDEEFGLSIPLIDG